MWGYIRDIQPLADRSHSCGIIFGVSGRHHKPTAFSIYSITISVVFPQIAIQGIRDRYVTNAGDDFESPNTAPWCAGVTATPTWMTPVSRSISSHLRANNSLLRIPVSRRGAIGTAMGGQGFGLRRIQDGALFWLLNRYHFYSGHGISSAQIILNSQIKNTP